MSKQYTIKQLFTADELKRALDIFAASKPGTFCDNVVREVVTPEVMARIDALTGQKNDARYMGYALEYAISAY